jgi:toxin YoeB
VNILFTKSAARDFDHWTRTDPRIHQRIVALIAAIEQSPFQGVGKPEPLKGDLAGWWSRRVTGEHRLVYRVTGKGKTRSLEVLSCRYHY